MVPDVALILLAGGVLVTVALEALTLLATQRFQLLASVTARSSHTRPTPTAGGIAFALPIVGYLCWLASRGETAAAVIALGGSALALTGLWDDRREVSAGLRLTVQVVAAAAVVWVLLPVPWLVGALVILAFVWHINLYNFMDGIDGLAGVQALVFFVGVQVVAQGLPGWAGDLSWLCAGCTLGFLVFNWPPARIFMGDVGSGFLGLITGSLALLLWQQQLLSPVAALILLAGFWFDATYTLIVRLLTGQAFTQAHRSHLYQKLAAKRGHLWTTVYFLLYAVVWLIPLAWLCVRSNAPLPFAFLWIVPAVAPLALASWRLQAGVPE